MKAEQPNISGTRIVIVEDDVSTISYYKAIFANSEADVTILKTGKEFADYIETGINETDIVIMDYLIPIINGIDCTRILRKNNKTIPVIMISAYYTEMTKTDAFLAGCNEYILKPIYPAKIYYLIEKYIKERCNAIVFE